MKKSEKKKRKEKETRASHTIYPSEFYLQTLHDCIENWVEFPIAFQITGKYTRPH